MEIDVDGKIICPYNRECRCTVLECEKCGWNPEVAERRLEKLREQFKTPESPLVELKYNVPFTGYCEVFAHSEEEALEKADNDQAFFIHFDYGDPVCLEKEEDDEMD